MNEFEKYYEMTETTGWRINDLNWKKVDKENISDFDKQVVLATAIIEHGVPHYTDTWARVRGLESEWELWQFVTLWAGEEHRHSYSLKKLADLLDINSDPNYYKKQAKGEYFYEIISNSKFAEDHKKHCSTDCYSTIAGMLTYTTIQELVTAKYYQNAAKRSKSRFLKDLLTYIAKDEFKHHAFYGHAIKRYYEKSNNKEQYIQDVYNATVNFEMPHTIYNQGFDFFDKQNIIGNLDMIEIKLRMGKLFAFDKTLLKNLATNKNFQDSEIQEKLAV
ncbi:MAG: acyl-ACP desaturase [Candidatus Sericytochromatia bacterium]